MALRHSKRNEPTSILVDPPCVVVVGDEPGALELLVRILRSAPHGWHVERARDHRELTEVHARREVLGVVVDIAAGGLGGGIKVLDAIRTSLNTATAALPVALVVASPNGALFAWQAGADELLVRPFHARELVDAVASAVTRSSDERVKHRRRQLAAAKSTGRLPHTGASPLTSGG